MKARIILSILFLLSTLAANSQQFWATQGSSPNGHWSIDVDCWCLECSEEEFIGPSQDDLDQGYTVTPNGNIFGMDDYNDIFQINPATGVGTLLIDLPHVNADFDLRGLASLSSQIFYSIDVSGPSDTLYEINVLTGESMPLGPLIHEILGDMTFLEGDLYYISYENFNPSISKITLGNPIVNELLVDLPLSQTFRALTATTQCHNLLSFDFGTDQFVIINTIDGDITSFGSNVNPFAGISSILEYQIPDCIVALDLDCDDSSGADGPDYNGPDYDCTTENGAPVCDYDILFLYDTLIDFVTIQLSGSIPDGANEYLELEQSYPNLIITGSGTLTITIESDGEASSTQFKMAMRAIRYKNDAFIPTPGIRTVEVNSATYSGASMNSATAIIEVIELPTYDLDLGPDVQVCEGDELIINTQLEDVEHFWSTNETSQSITVPDPGTYSVTVTGDEFCPAIDSISVTFLPLVLVELGNDIVVCEGEEVVITITTSSPFPLTIEMISFPGGPFTLTGITGYTEIPVIAIVPVTYVILSVTSAQPACIEILDNEQIIDVIPSYNDTLVTGLCEGDSLRIGSQWITAPGIYTVYDNTQFGCDSIVTYVVSFTKSIMIFEVTNTCNAADTGVFTQVIINPDGCDTIIETHVILGSLDTTFTSSLTCRTGEEGVMTNILTSTGGCDSVVINTVILLPPQDTSWVLDQSCDTLLIGVSYSIYESHSGCDSLVITTVSAGIADTTNQTSTSCDSSSLGVFEMLFQNQYACDSLVILTVLYSISDSTFISSNTCDVSGVGVFISAYNNQFGCDSIVIEDVKWVPEVHTNIQSVTCDPLVAGTFIDTLSSAQGCDSIVTEVVQLLPSQSIEISSTTCAGQEAGIFVLAFLNQYGCDSIVTETVTLLPSNEIQQTGITCDISETGVFVDSFINQFGCDSIVTLTINLALIDTSKQQFFTCEQDEVVYEELIFTGTDGCDSFAIVSVELYPPPHVEIVSILNYNGYDISCEGAKDAIIEVHATASNPVQYTWNTGETDTTLSGLGAGSYQLTVLDGNGCSAVESIDLQQPLPLMINLNITHPSCFVAGDGKIEVVVIGGVAPYTYSLDGIHFQSSSMFEGLPGGMYTIIIKDANDCQKEEWLLINAVLPVNVDLGDDIIIETGEQATIQAVVNVPYDSLSIITWIGVDDNLCEGCLTQVVAPIITTVYSIEVTSIHGCMDKDELKIQVEETNSIYIPNVFSPNGDGINDVHFIRSKTPGFLVSQFNIYDRWGDVIFKKDFLANDPSNGWDGRFVGRRLNSAVFTYKVILRTPNNEQEVRYGTITLLDL